MPLATKMASRNHWNPRKVSETVKATFFKSFPKSKDFSEESSGLGTFQDSVKASTKGFSAQPGKREAMIIKYVERTGCSKEVAEKEVDEYLADKEGYVIRKRAEEAKAAAEKDKQK